MCGSITGNYTNAAGAVVQVQKTFPGSFGILGMGWVELTFLALLCSLLILVLVYIVANFLRNQQLLSWTKFELFQILATAVTVLFVVLAIVPGMCSFDMSFLGKSPVLGHVNPYVWPDGHPMNMYDIVDNYFSRVEGVGYLLFAYMMYIVKVVNLIARITWTANPIGIGSTDSPLEAASQINSIFFLMFSGYVTSFLLMQFQMRMLEYLAVAVVWYLFPFGVFLRAFEPTRTFGGMLIGLSIALFLFYPIIMVFNSYIIDSTGMRQGLENDVNAAATSANSGVSNVTTQAVGNAAKNLSVSELNNKSGQTAQFSGQQLTNAGAMSYGITGGVLALLKPVMLYMIAAVVLPVLNFIVLVEIVRGTSAFFGEEIDVSNLTRLI